jgi:hypothetical protein
MAHSELVVNLVDAQRRGEGARFRTLVETIIAGVDVQGRSHLGRDREGDPAALAQLDPTHDLLSVVSWGVHAPGPYPGVAET